MADVKISGLPASTVPLAGTEVLPIVQGSTTKQVTIANVTAGRAISAASLALTTSPLPLTSGGTGVTSAPAAMANLMGFTTTVTSATPVVLTNTSSYYQVFTGSTAQTVTLPVVSTLAQGWSFHICNNSSAVITVNSSGSNLVLAIPAGVTAMYTCILITGTTAASWEAGLTDFSTVTGTGSVVLSSLPTFGTTVGVGGATASASGSGVSFPATQSASTDANTLDDYEEGTWTPNVGGTATYTLQDGRYVKVGQNVFCTGKLIINVLGTGSASTISGLPFTQQATSNGLTGTGTPSFWNNFNVNAISVILNVVNNSTTFYTVITNAAGTAVTLNQPNFMKDNTRLDFSLTYIASA
jgi:hypothetical protein